ncbi:hypothetical protein D9611_009058 [Ephemerocybe angulata]|uniref:N-acetyltransferase domain-containing protein n=1 Tax=Ephemerocybe angulata TaxID=980116 RepID=A0A8H5CDD9_9AGAR|nr:hypothetical protein D9611_009058 [Tulosesus angulatus]
MPTTYTSADPPQSRTVPYVRLATEKDYPQLIALGTRAFAKDPMLLYVGSVQQMSSFMAQVQGHTLAPSDEGSLRIFMEFVLYSTLSKHGRITVAAVPSDLDNNEMVASATYWLPPSKLVETRQATKPRDGAASMLGAWGVGGTARMTEDYLKKVHNIIVNSFKRRGFQESEVGSSAWYLNLAMTDPALQGRGFLSMLMREQFAHAPGQTYILETTTEKAKNQYLHYGFELQETFCAGEGQIGVDGLPATHENGAGGVKAYPMIKASAKTITPCKVVLTSNCLSAVG